MDMVHVGNNVVVKDLEFDEDLALSRLWAPRRPTP